MRDVVDPFLTFYRADPDHNKQDSRAEVEALYQRQGVIEDFLEGKAKSDEVLDLLQEQGIDAAEYADSVHQHVEAIIDSGIVYLSNESGLLLPQGVVL